MLKNTKNKQFLSAICIFSSGLGIFSTSPVQFYFGLNLYPQKKYPQITKKSTINS